jgi:DNA-binding transcriptional MocR family regulator
MPMLIPGLTLDDATDVPVYRQIADGIRSAAADGRLAPGHRLPATRDLARQLGVNRNTVVAAYDELAAAGWVESHTGRGTFVAARPPAAAAGAHDEALSEDGWLMSFSRAVEGPAIDNLRSFYQLAIADEGISFAGSYPAADLLPVDAFRRAMEATLDAEGERAFVYGPTAGHGPLRETIAARMRANGARTDAENVLITNGAQQAIELVFHAFVERGEAVAIEEPTYTGALSVLGSLGARVIGVPVDDEGIRPDLLALALERHRPKLLYVQPTFQNPTSGEMGEARRRAVLSIAARNRCVVVEDDWAGGLRYEGEEPPSLWALDGGRRTIHLGTFSKKLLPGLRLGWVAAPPAVMERLAALKQIRDCGTSLLLQAVLHRFLEDGGLEEHLTRVLPSYRRRRDTMLRALGRCFPTGAAWTRPRGGMFVWATLPADADGEALFQAARQRGVLYSKGDLFHPDGGGRNTLRLAFSAASPSEIDSGVATLGELLRELASEPSGERARQRSQAVPIL